jgi:hypothetical protein
MIYYKKHPSGDLNRSLPAPTHDEPHLIPSPHNLHSTIQQHFLPYLLKKGYWFDIRFWVDLLRFWRHGVINPVDLDNAGFDACNAFYPECSTYEKVLHAGRQNENGHGCVIGNGFKFILIYRYGKYDVLIIQGQ